jgi:hypothetical protein
MSDWSDEETDDPHYADRRNFYKVEKWSRDGLRVELMLYAGNSLDKARVIFKRTTKHGPRPIRQRMRVLDEWPRPPRWRDCDISLRSCCVCVRIYPIARPELVAAIAAADRHSRRHEVDVGPS